MKFAKTAIAGILLLLAASASAQQFPTVPSQSVIGRLGTPGQSGPSQAIPFSNLAAQLSPNLLYTAPFTGAVTETQNAYNAQRISVKDFGAKCDGTTNDTAAIQAALNTGKTVILPDNATCKTTAALTISLSGTGLVGSGQMSSALSITSTTASAIIVNANVVYVTLQNFRLLRVGTPGTGAEGILFNGDTEETNISNMWIQGHYDGLSVRTTGYSQISNLVLTNNFNDGFICTDVAGSNGFQWYIFNVLSELNGHNGFTFATAVGATGASVGNWVGLYSFANTNFGLVVAGTASLPINGIRLYNSFFGSDGQGEVYLDTYGSLHSIANTFLELAGTSTTGPNFTTPATHVGNGLTVTANNVDVSLNNIYSTGHSSAGFTLAATALNALNNSRASGNTTFGAIIADGAKTQLSGNSFSGNTSGNLSVTANASSLISKGNSPVTIDNITGIANGGTGQASAAAARGSSGLNVDQFTGQGNANYTILATDRTVGTNAAFTASRTWTLPAANAVNPGQEIVVADFQGTVTGINTLIIARAGADTINGVTSVTIASANGAYLFKSDGTSKWTAQALGSAAAGGLRLLASAPVSVNFNSANTDTAIPVTLPAGFTKIVPFRLVISGASGTLTTSTFGMFSATAGGGFAIQTAGTANTISTAADATVNNTQNIAVTGLAASMVAASLPTPNTVYFRVGTAQGVAATANVTFYYFVE